MKDSLIQWLTWGEVSAATHLVGNTQHTQLALSCCAWGQNKDCFVLRVVLGRKFDFWSHIIWKPLHFTSNSQLGVQFLKSKRNKVG